MNTIEEELESVWSEFEPVAQIIAKKVDPAISSIEVMQFIKLSVQKAYLAGQLTTKDGSNQTNELTENMLDTLKKMASSFSENKK